ncbi:MAG: Gfo/Idh/MocA family oxidoreductase [Bacilli bacterium]
MKYALIGCGRISPNHVAAAIKNGLEIEALCDVIPEHIDEVLGKFENEITAGKEIRKYTDYKEMIACEKIDLVGIATESGLHAQIALDCIEKGIHCIIEKPIAMSMKDAQAICDAAQKNDVVVCANHQNRFNKSIIKIREAMEAGKFGRLLHGTAHIRWNRNQGYYTQAPWRGTWAQDGGCLMNQCIHNVDLLRWMMGDEIEEVMAYTDNLNHDFIEAEDLGMALIKFKNGSYGMLEGTTNVYPKNLEETLYIFGEKGTVKAGGKSVNIIEEWDFENDVEDASVVKEENSEQPDSVYGFGHNPLYTDVIHAIETHTKPLVDAEAGKRALELVLAIYKSAAEGKPVKLPLTDVASVDFTGRFGK